MCIQFGNPSEPCCGGKFLDWIVTSAVMPLWSARTPENGGPNAWVLNKTGNSSANRQRDFVVQFKKSNSKTSDGKRLGTVVGHMPPLPSRLFLSGFPTPGVSSFLFVGDSYNVNAVQTIRMYEPGQPNEYQTYPQASSTLTLTTAAKGNQLAEISSVRTSLMLRDIRIQLYLPSFQLQSTNGNALDVAAPSSYECWRIGEDQIGIPCDATLIPNMGVWGSPGSPTYEQYLKVRDPFVVFCGLHIGFSDNSAFDSERPITAKNYPLKLGIIEPYGEIVSPISASAVTIDNGDASQGNIEFGTSGPNVRYRIIHNNASLLTGRRYIEGANV